MAPSHFVRVVMSVGSWKHMSDIFVTYQSEDKLMHKVTFCAQLHPAPYFFGYSALSKLTTDRS